MWPKSIVTPAPASITRFDRILKALSDESPPVLMYMIGVAPLDGAVTVSPLRPETAPTVVFPDYAAVLSVESADPFTFHAEFQLLFNEEIPPRMARCGGSLAWQYQRRVVSALLLLWKKGAPGTSGRLGSTRSAIP